MKSMGLELPGMVGLASDGVGGGGGGGGGGDARKREVLMREARYGVGSVLVEEGAAPTMVFVIVEGECRIVKSGKSRSQAPSTGEDRPVHYSNSLHAPVLAVRYLRCSGVSKHVRIKQGTVVLSTRLDRCYNETT